MVARVGSVLRCGRNAVLEAFFVVGLVRDCSGQHAGSGRGSLIVA
ncbi:hypothetical protein [Saccharopolyspora pogona]|nr:hypothetical protein [Saccharopolyspora pogona]